MGEIRLYKKFLCINATTSANTTNVLFDPFSLSADTNAVNSTTKIEKDLTIEKESTGTYYVDLNPNLYSADITYDLNWNIDYLNGAPTKKLITRFRLNPIIIGQEISIEILKNNIDIELE